MRNKVMGKDALDKTISNWFSFREGNYKIINDYTSVLSFFASGPNIVNCAYLFIKPYLICRKRDIKIG